MREASRKTLLHCAFLIRAALPQEGDLHLRVRNLKSGELVMEENSRPMGESPNGIAMPDAAITGPGRSGSAFVYVTFLPSPFGPGYTAGIRGWEGNYDPVDGWADGTYYRLAGVAGGLVGRGRYRITIEAFA